MESGLEQFIIFLHSTIRWIILFSFGIAFIKSILSFITRDRITASIVIGNKLSMILMDVQLLIGLSLYFFISSTTKAAFSDWKIAMQTKELRFFAVEHITLMLIATICFHAVNIILKKEYPQHKKVKLVTGIYVFIFALFLAGIPWFRPVFRGI